MMQKPNRLFMAFALIFMMTGAAMAQNTLFSATFDAAVLDTTTKWKRGSNSSLVITQNNYLRVLSQSDSATGWIVTKAAYGGINNKNISASLKILKPGIESDLGLCPTSPVHSEPNGIYNQSNYYRFYISGPGYQPPYTLLVYKKKNGATETPLHTFELPSPYDAGNTPFHIRIRLGEEMIYFEYSKDGCYWYVVYFERFDLPNYMTSTPFYYEIAASNKLVGSVRDTLKVDDFKIESYLPTGYPATTILNDTLKSSTFNSSANPGVSRKVWGGNFIGGKWKPSSSQPNANMVYYDLGRYIENGSLEIDVTKFYPPEQNNPDTVNIPRHHVLAMFRQPWVGHHAVEDVDMFWDLHTGNQFSGGVKFLSNTYYSCDEFTTEIIGGSTRRWAQWVKSTTPYRLKITWDNLSLKYFRNDTLHAWHVLKNPMQLRYLCVGRDSTVSADKTTGYMHNQYPTMSDADGPLYSNLIVKELRPSTAAPVINNSSVVDRYQNAARISWATSAAAVCYVKYGLTTTYGKTTKVLGPPATAFTTLLANLFADTTYHYKIYAEGEGGQIVQSADSTFRTATNGIYVFKPVADTYIEANDRTPSTKPTKDHGWLYGPTRAEGNYGWMNLMTAESRDAFLQFNVAGATGTINQATLRLYGRRTNANTGADVKQFTPVLSNWELNATWLDATSTHQYLNRSTYSSAPLLDSFSSTTMGQWHSVNVSATTPNGNNYYFVLQGTGRAGDPGDDESYLHGGSFDSRESPNNQPELIISTIQPTFTEVNISLPGVEDGDAAWGDYDKDGDMDIIITGLGTADLPVSKILRNNNNGASFDTLTFALTPLSSSTAAWGDFDMDNDLDLVLAGQSSSGKVTQVYRNDNNSFVAHTTSLTGIIDGDAAWGNYNHDKYLDLLISGRSDSASYYTKLYQGSSSGSTRTWAPTTIALPQLQYSAVAWGDNNLDGYVDLLLAGTNAANANIIKVYNNNAAQGFTPATNGPPQDMIGSLAWGNFDTDDDLDMAFAGRSNALTSVYKRKSDATFESVDAASLIDVKRGTVAWGDYDNDGDLDLLVTGELANGTARISKVYRNDPPPAGSTSRKFVDINAPLIGVHNGAAAWGDYDNNGDLDILLAGNTNASGASSRITKIYKNILNVPNDSSSTPNNLTVSYSATDSVYTLKWAKANDDRTPQAALTYNVMIGTSSNSFNIVSPMSNKYTGKRWIPARGNAETDTSYILNRRGLATGIYYWKVQAVDNIWEGSAFSAEATFTVTLAKAAETDSLADSDSTATAHAIPKTFALSHNYPNPFNPSTRLNLNLPENGRVKAIVYNLMGQEVARLQDAAMTAGYRYLNWDGKNKFGANVSSGTYLVKVVFEGVSGVRKESTSRILLVK